MSIAASRPVASLQERLDFIGLDGPARMQLRKLAPFVDAKIGAALGVFYGKVGANAHTRGFFSAPGHMLRARERQARHWGVILGGAFDDDYARNVDGIGKAHARMGLEPRWYIGGYALVLEQLLRAFVADRWPAGLMARKRQGEEFADALVALLKASLLDMDLSISVYLSELEDRRRAAEDARLAGEQNQAQAVRAIASALSRLACGDLRSRIDETLAPEFESLKGDYNAALDRLQECMEDVARAASMISDATGEITDSSEDLSKRTEARAANLEQTSAALVQINQSVRQTAGNTASVDDIMTRTRADAEQSGDIVADAMQTMAAIERSSKNANQIIVVIDEIAFQTNLLALNAGVEAARAGEAGRGFAVVAAEVRSLAQRSSEAAKEIEQLLGDTQTQIRQGVTLVENTVAALSKIGAQVSSASLVVTDITKSAREQATVLDQIAKALDQLDHATQQDAAMVQETSAATRSLRKETDALIAAVRRFELAAASASVERRHTPLRLVGGR